MDIESQIEVMSLGAQLFNDLICLYLPLAYYYHNLSNKDRFSDRLNFEFKCFRHSLAACDFLYSDRPIQICLEYLRTCCSGTFSFDFQKPRKHPTRTLMTSTVVPTTRSLTFIEIDQRSRSLYNSNHLLPRLKSAIKKSKLGNNIRIPNCFHFSQTKKDILHYNKWVPKPSWNGKSTPSVLYDHG